MSSDAEFIYQQLATVPDRKVAIKSDGLWICCPNPEHSGGNERTGSLRIKVDNTKYPNRFKCFGCDWTGHYNDIAKMLNLEKVDSDFKPVGTRQLSFKSKMRARDPETTYNRSTFKWPEDRDWRGIKAKTILRDGAELSDVRNDLDEPRLIFPVTMWGERVGEIYALIRDPVKGQDGEKAEVSYLNKSGPWKEKSLFGFDRARRLLRKYPWKPLWLVEGPRDRYHCEESGCITVANIGSSFSEAKAELIRVLNPHRLLVASDNDFAGNKLAARVNELLYKQVPMTRIRFKEGEDPMDQSKKKLRSINERFFADEGA